MQAVGVFPRFIAVFIDAILLGIVGYAMAIPFGAATSTGFNLTGAPALLFFLVALAYYVVLETTKGATLGKMAMGLRVVRLDNGGPIDWKASIIRNILRIVDGLFFYLVGAICVWVSKNRQRLGDMAAKTVVVRKGKDA